MVALPSLPNEPTRRTGWSGLYRRTPRLWRAMIRIDAALIAMTGRLRVTGEIDERLCGAPLLIAANHIGNLDPLVLIAACRRRRIAPRFMATAGLFEAPVVGGLMRACGHVRTDRGRSTATDVIGTVQESIQRDPCPVLAYPEGRISLEPGLWPERGKTGLARLALATGAPVVPISQWGAHEAMCYGMKRVESPRDAWVLLRSWLRAITRRPTLTVHFGAPVDLSDLTLARPGDAVRAHARIMRAITEGLEPLRRDEPNTPRHHDPTRPVTGKTSPWRD